MRAVCEGQKVTFRSRTLLPPPPRSSSGVHAQESDLGASVSTPLDPGSTSLRRMAKVLTDPNSKYTTRRINYKEAEHSTLNATEQDGAHMEGLPGSRTLQDSSRASHEHRQIRQAGQAASGHPGLLCRLSIRQKNSGYWAPL